MRALAFLVVSLLSGAFLATRLEVRTAITDFLPRDEQTGLIELARELAEAPQSRVVIFTLATEKEETRAPAARAFAAQLAGSGLFAWVRSGLSETDQQRLYDTFFPARLGLLTLPGGKGPVPDAYLDAQIAAMRERLAGELSMLERRLAPADPLGSFAGLLARQQAARGRLRLDGDQLITEDGRYAVLFAATKASAFDGRVQAQVEAEVARALAAARAVSQGARVEWSGINRYALAGERSVRGDIERISTLSLLGIFLLYLLWFRSLREPLLVLLPIGFGCLLAAAVCQLVFGFVHGLALAFGSAIIGVAEDYSTHYLTHRAAVSADEGNEPLMRRLWPGMLMGGLTTIIGIAMLFFSAFPGLQQMAVFGAVGVLGALAATRILLPPLARRTPHGLPTRSHQWGDSFLRALDAHPRRALMLLVPPLALMAVGLPRLSFDDQVAALKTPAPALDAANQRIQARLGRSAPVRVVVAVGDDDEQALARAEAVRDRLAAARAEGALAGYRTVVDLIPSAATQAETLRRMRDDQTFVPRFREALGRAGFVASAFQPFEDALAQPVRPLTPAALLGTDLADLIAPFRAPLAHRIAYLTPVEGGRDLTDRLRGLAGVHYLDQESLFSAAYGRFRARTMTLLSIGLVLVLGTLLARYRDLRIAAIGMLPAVIGAGAALGIEALRGVSGSMMHVIGALLVMSMGVDYGIYALESRQHQDERATTLLGMLLAALTTVLSFGLLGLSENPALAAIGATVGFGMVFTVAASPVVLALTRTE